MKTALVARLGVIGDQIMASSVLPLLKRDGYHITYMAYEPFGEILRHDPHIDILRVIDKGKLGAGKEFLDFWRQITPAYDRVIHLSESLEKLIVFMDDQLQFWWDDIARRNVCNKNYLEQTHDVAGVPYEFNPRFYESEEEKKAAEAMISSWRTGPVFGIAVAGSGFDKMYHKLPHIAVGLLSAVPGSKLILFAGDNGRDKLLVQAILQLIRDTIPDGMSKVRHTIGWSIRKSLSVAQHIDVLVGPDTGIQWATAFNERVGNVVMLSHASPENITKHWPRVTTLHANQQKVSCWPCHKLHRGPETCRVNQETGAASCIGSISAETVVSAALKILRE
jgi:ADP-heptose:LPS heptosyltransferase